MPRKDLVLIVGMIRSGSSAITRVLSLCGCALPQLVLGSPNLMKDWRGEVGRVSKSLDIDLDCSRSEAVGDFLSDSLHHQKEPGTILEQYGNSWISQVYTTLSAAARDEPLDCALLDDIHDAYSASERAFRTAYDSFRSRFNAARIRETRAGLHVWRSGQDF